MSFGKPRRFLRLSSARLAAAYVAVFSVGICALLTAVYFLTVGVLDRETDALIEAEITNLRDDYDSGGLLQLVQTLRLRMDDFGQSGAVYLLTDASGRRVAGNISQWPTLGTAHEKWFEFNIESRRGDETVIHPVRARTFFLPEGYWLIVGRNLLERQRFFQSLRTALIVGIGLCILLATLIGFGYRWRVRRRVLGIAETCESVMAGDLSRRLSLDGSHDEFDALSAAVNAMLERIEHQTSTLRTTFDSAAHDLRAPLYRARVRLEETLQHSDLAASVRETMESTLGELERVQRTLGTLLQIAQAEGQTEGNSVATDIVDIAALARELVELYRPEATERGLELEYDAPGQANARGNRQLLAQALVNLLENSLKYVPSGGHVRVTVSFVSQDVVLDVADDGPGIPQERQAEVLRPFARLERDRDRMGSGLGLSLVAAVMRLHRATLELLDNHPGLRVRCKIPAAD